MAIPRSDVDGKDAELQQKEMEFVVSEAMGGVGGACNNELSGYVCACPSSPQFLSNNVAHFKSPKMRGTLCAWGRGV